MRLKSILATALAVVAVFSSCSKEDNGSGSLVNGDQANLNVSFKLPQTVTRTQTAATAESAVNSISVYVFESSGVKKSTGAHTSFTSADFTEVGGLWKLNSDKSVATTAGAAKIYIGVNVPSAMQKEYASETLLLAEVTALSAVNNSDASTGFTMFSAATVTSLLPLTNNPSNDYVNTITPVNVDRVVSKVVASVTDAPGATDFNKKWSSVSAVAGIMATSPVINFVYDVKEYGIYQDAVKSYLVKNTSTVVNNVSVTGVIQTRANSLLVANQAINIGHGNNSNRINWSGFYVGENTPTVPALKGNTTYVMVTTTLKLDQAADWDATDKVVKYTAATYGEGTSDIFMIRYEGYTFVTNTLTKASDIKVGLDALDISGVKKANIYTYTKGYVHFRVWLNKNADNDYRVGRNEYIHVKVNSIADIDGNFPGYPGNPSNPVKPIEPDPTTPDPSNPDPGDPKDPVDGQPAALKVEIEINPWTYSPNETILQ